ncbi:MAG: TIGR03915 family putative DNA repair protein [Christensenella sp.]|nr:TIGR03915 family putative DNA repair protein [Christensenella sp.]
MPNRRDVVYYYDGSFEGLMCCVFESFMQKEIPLSLNAPDCRQMTLFPTKEIQTDEAKAHRVLRSIPQKICPEAAWFIRRAFLTCLPEKERYILLFLHKGFQNGAKTMRMLADETVNTLDKSVRNLGNEAHLLSGFIRFSIYGQVMAAQISPKNFVLPILGPHFAQRYPDESFLIYDSTHEMALTYEQERLNIRPVEDFSMPAPTEEEQQLQKLWKMFYRTIAIEGRYNPRCRMSMMPKRYWQNMTEFADDYKNTDLTCLPIQT